MECVYFGTWDAARSGWCGGAGAGPWVMADLENGLWACNASRAVNPLAAPQTSEFVLGMVKGGVAQWGIKAGDAAKGPLVKTWEGPRPSGYQPMRKQGSVLLVSSACALRQRAPKTKPPPPPPPPPPPSGYRWR